LDPGATQRVNATVIFKKKKLQAVDFPKQEENTGTILVYEARNSDTFKKITYTANVFFEVDAFKVRTCFVFD
jgi:hypothetical protein